MLLPNKIKRNKEGNRGNWNDTWEYTERRNVTDEDGNTRPVDIELHIETDAVRIQYRGAIKLKNGYVMEMLGDHSNVDLKRYSYAIDPMCPPPPFGVVEPYDETVSSYADKVILMTRDALLLTVMWGGGLAVANDDEDKDFAPLVNYLEQIFPDAEIKSIKNGSHDP